LPFQLGLTMALYGFELLRRRCASTPDPRLPTPDSRLFFFPRSGGQRVALLLMAMLALYVAIDPHLLAMGLLLAVLGVWSVFWAHCPADGLVNPPLFGGVADAGVRVGLRRLLYPLAMLGAGLLLAATMRPTFWILLVSLVLACAVGLLRPPRLAPAITILVLAAAALLFVLALDLRHQGVHPLKGGYEDKVMAKLAALPRTLAEADEGLKHKLLQTHVTMLLHGIELLPTPAWAGRLWTLLLLAAAVGLARRNLLWGLLVICSVVTIAIFGSVPRYFLVILPMLLAGYGLLTQQIAVRLSRILPSRWAGYLRTGLMLWGLGLVTLPNCVRCLDLAAEQHGLTRHGLRPFVEAYDSGKWQPIVQISRMIHDNVSPGQRVLGPEATVTAFLSQRQVLSLGMLVSHDWKRHFSRQVLEARLDLVVMPKSVYLVENRDRIMDAVLRWRLLVESDCVADSGPYRLSHFSVRDGRGQHLIPVRHTHRETAAPVSTMTATFPDS